MSVTVIQPRQFSPETHNVVIKDMAHAVEWVKCCPNPMPAYSDIEIRPVFEAADFGEVLTP